MKEEKIHFNSIIVRTGKAGHEGRVTIGKMHKVTGSYGNNIAIPGGWSIDKGNCRLAKPAEINAFNRGVRQTNPSLSAERGSIDSFSII